MQRRLDQIDEEIESITIVLSQTPDDDPNMRVLLLCLAEAHNERFCLRNEPNDIQKVVKCMSIVLTLTPDDDLSFPRLLNDLGIAHGQLFKRLGDQNDIERAIEYMSLTFKLIPESDLDFPRRLANLAVFHTDRFELLGAQEDIETAIEYESQVVAMTPKDHPSYPAFLEGLGTSHSRRFQRFGEPKDLESAIEYQSCALALTPDNDPRLSLHLVNLAVSHRRRFGRLGELNDLEKAIKHETRALALVPDDHPRLPTLLANLAISHRDRFERLGELSDLDQAIKYGARAVALTPDDHPQLSIHLANLAVPYTDRFRRLGELSDLEQAINYEERALALTPDDHADLSTRLANLAVSHTNRFQRLGELSDLEQAIKHLTRALSLTPENHPDFSGNLANLAVSHNLQFGRLGELNDLELAINYETRALALTPDDHPDLSRRLANLAVSHSHRFRRLGELSDLEQSIKHQLRALALTPDNHPEWLRRLANLAGSYGNRFQLLGKLSDLEQSINYLIRALAMIPDDHPDLSTYLANLALSYSIRFQRLDELSDLEQAIKHQFRALTLTPDDHPHLSARLANLGASHGYLFQRHGELQDLEQAIKYGSRATAAVTSDHPSSCLWQFNLANYYVHFYNHSTNLVHLQQSLSLFRTACRSMSGAPRDRFRLAHQWAFFATEHNILNPIEAYQTAIDLLPQFVWLGATTDQRYQDLKTVQSLAVHAAHAAILSSNYQLALEWLDITRCVVWNQNLMLRSPLEPLIASHPALATRLQVVAGQLHTSSSTSRESQALYYSVTPEQVGQDHRRLAKEYEDLLAQARIQPGFEDFLRPLTANRLILAARNGPIVLINCHPNQCDALVVLPKQPNVMHIPLPNFNGQKAQAARLELHMSVESLRLRERGDERRPLEEAVHESEFGPVLADLWHNVVKPVLDHLGYTRSSSTQDLPHITWCPTGAMTFLPLHAAGDYDKPHSRVFDYAISSYTPTLTALLESLPQSLSRDSRALAVGQAATLGHAPLPGTALELDCVRARTQGKVEYTQLMDSQATVSTVLDEMEQHDWVHLACHAHQNVDDPKKSGFFLSDGVLDLDEINRRSLKGKGLAFLSACQTATGDKDLPDEAVHLASGMLMAGYSSVIATMWSVGDSDAPLVADKVYSELMKNGTLGNGEAGRALHDAVGELRASVGEKEFRRWVPFIHIGS